MASFKSKFSVFLILSFIFTNFSISHQTVFAETANIQDGVNTGSYIIGFNNQIDEELIQSLGGSIELRLESIGAVSATLSNEAVKQLALSSEVRFIELDKPVVLEEQYIDPRIYDLNFTKVINENNNFTGRGLKIGVMDTGIDIDHSDLRVAGGVSFVPGIASYDDDNGHGTHVAGIIGAQDNTIGVKGIAPNAELYSIKVLDTEGAGQHSQIISGIEWAVQNGLDIVNLSLAGEGGSSALKLAVDEAYNKGLLIVAASGNHSDTTFSEDQYVMYPAKYSSVIAVGAVDEDKKHPNFSGAGPELEFVAPGVNIYSTFLNNRYETHTGTSMATPYVSAIFALYKEAYPLLTPSQLRSKIQGKALDLGAIGRDVNYGFGLIQAPVLDKNPPTVPGNLNYKITDTGITLKWTASVDESKIKGYNVFRNGTKIKSLLNGTQFTEKVSPGFYLYEVSAVDDDGNESPKSKIDTVVYLTFPDITSSKWYAPFVYDLTARKSVGGYPDGKFYPEKPITRGEAVSMIGRALQLEGTQRSTPFPDVPSSYFASGYIASMAQKKFAGGFPDGTFKPAQTITRAEVVSLLDRAYSFQNISGSPKVFPDVPKSHFAYVPIQHLSLATIANGYPDGTFKPQQPVTRAEMSVFLSRTIEEKQ